MVYVFLAPGFEELEALTPVDLLRRAGIDVMTVSIDGPLVSGAHGITVQADCVADGTLPPDVEMILLPGGGLGTENLGKSSLVAEALDWAASHGRYIAAICAAPSILGKQGLLRGRKAVCFPGFEETLEGAVYTDRPVVVDGSFITAKGAGAAVPFSFELIRILRGQEAADDVRKSIQYAQI